LRFCLQDGSALKSADDAPFDPNATLQSPEGWTGRREPPPTEVLSAPTAETLQQPKAAPTAMPQPPRVTVRDAPAFAPPPPRSQNSALVVGLTITVAILLLALGGVGAWVLLRGDEGGGARGAENQNNTAPTENSNRRAAANDSTSSATPAPSPSAAASPVDEAAIREQVTATLNGWASASMAHDINAHMSYYAQTLDVYYSSTNVSASQVRADRERAYAVYSTIDIRLSNIKVTVEKTGTRATATFDKTWNFEGSKYSSGSVQQRIWLTKTGGRWLITGEKDLQVYYVNK
jgi:ketosteroid isomerase-like protein